MRIQFFRTLTLAAALSIAAAPAWADDKAMGPPKPAKELSQLAYFSGTWACTGKAMASPMMGPEHASEGTAKASLGLGGFWYTVHYDETKTAANTMPYHLTAFWGYDAAEKTFVSSCHDAMGAYCQQTSKGWSGDTLTWEGDTYGMGPKMKGRDTFTKKSATEMTHAGEIQGPDGKWMKTDEETCTKAAKK